VPHLVEPLGLVHHLLSHQPAGTVVDQPRGRPHIPRLSS
jgi:hypothetical protein